MNASQIITNLRPGQSVKISGDARIWVEAERSGDGKTLRMVRCTPHGFEVFRTSAF